jgi:hypothetical protein
MFTKLKDRVWFKIKRYLSKRRKSDLRKAFKTIQANQAKIIDIVNFLMTNQETKFVYSAISNSMYLEYKDVVCKIENDSIIITNGLYSYNISVSSAIIVDIMKKYYSHLESRKRSTDKRIIEKLTSSLGKVHSQLMGKENI